MQKQNFEEMLSNVVRSIKEEEEPDPKPTEVVSPVITPLNNENNLNINQFLLQLIQQWFNSVEGRSLIQQLLQKELLELILQNQKTLLEEVITEQFKREIARALYLLFVRDGEFKAQAENMFKEMVAPELIRSVSEKVIRDFFQEKFGK